MRIVVAGSDATPSSFWAFAAGADAVEPDAAALPDGAVPFEPGLGPGCDVEPAGAGRRVEG
jgi:hypothetical protein